MITTTIFIRSIESINSNTKVIVHFTNSNGSTGRLIVPMDDAAEVANYLNRYMRVTLSAVEG